MSGFNYFMGLCDVFVAKTQNESFFMLFFVCLLLLCHKSWKNVEKLKKKKFFFSFRKVKAAGYFTTSNVGKIRIKVLETN